VTLGVAEFLRRDIRYGAGDVSGVSCADAHEPRGASRHPTKVLLALQDDVIALRRGRQTSLSVHVCMPVMGGAKFACSTERSYDLQ